MINEYIPSIIRNSNHPTVQKWHEVTDHEERQRCIQWWHEIRQSQYFNPVSTSHVTNVFNTTWLLPLFQDVQNVIVDSAQKACGVALQDGTEIKARFVLSNATPKVTFLDLLDEVSQTLPSYEFIE